MKVFKQISPFLFSSGARSVGITRSVFSEYSSRVIVSDRSEDVSGVVSSIRTVFSPSSSSFNIFGCIFENVICGSQDGSVYVSGEVNLTVTNCFFNNCTSLHDCAGLYTTCMISVITRSCFNNMTGVHHVYDHHHGGNCFYAKDTQETKASFNSFTRANFIDSSNHHAPVLVSSRSFSSRSMNFSHCRSKRASNWGAGLCLNSNTGGIDVMYQVFSETKHGSPVVLSYSKFFVYSFFFSTCLFINNTDVPYGQVFSLQSSEHSYKRLQFHNCGALVCFTLSATDLVTLLECSFDVPSIELLTVGGPGTTTLTDCFFNVQDLSIVGFMRWTATALCDLKTASAKFSSSASSDICRVPLLGLIYLSYA